MHKYFDAIPPGNGATVPRTVEPQQNGARRIVLRGPTRLHYFHIAYRAPAATDPDYPAFLILQSVLTRSGGVNFLQRAEGDAGCIAEMQ